MIFQSQNIRPPGTVDAHCKAVHIDATALPVLDAENTRIPFSAPGTFKFTARTHLPYPPDGPIRKQRCGIFALVVVDVSYHAIIFVLVRCVLRDTRLVMCNVR